MIVDIVDKYFTDDNNPIKNLRLNVDLTVSFMNINICNRILFTISFLTA
jgi:hypothetical protein